MTPKPMHMPFRPLLRQITECLNFKVPVFGFVNAATNNACVAVRTECGPIAYVYVGGEASVLDDSCERAAKATVPDLIGKYGVHVEDFTAGKKLMLDKCAHLYRLKRTELENIKKGLPTNMVSHAAYSSVPVPLKHVTVDYMSVLPMVVKHTQALLTPLETICFDGCKHTSWLTVTCPHSAHGIKCIFGHPCGSLIEAKQSLAEKVISYLMQIYNFSIIDANYKAANYASILCALERESYLTLKERVLNIQEAIQPCPLVVEQDCLTPRGIRFRIPTMVSPPLPPKKRKARPSFGNVLAFGTGLAIPLLPIPSQLDTVRKRAKQI